MENYYKNFILCGEIDYYCLLCQETFGDKIEIEKHMRWEKHRKDKKRQEYLSKFKNDFIYKINDYFYCEVCNVTIINVLEHVKGEHHQAYKYNPKPTKKISIVKRKPDGTIELNDKILNKLQWHGIRTGQCLLCDTNINNVSSHISSFNHMSNLTQSIIKGTDNNDYRELNSGKFYCFTCFATFQNKYLSNHWIDNHSNKLKSDLGTNKHEHNIIQNSKFDANNIHNMMIKILAERNSQYYSVDVDKKIAKCLECTVTVEATPIALYEHRNVHHPLSDLGTNKHEHNTIKNSKFDANNNIHNMGIKILAERNSQYYSIDVDKKIAKCLECTVTVEATSIALYEHRNVHHPNSVKAFDNSWHIDHGKRRSELAKYGKKNYIKFNEGCSKGFCTLCNIHISAHINVAKQHVEGAYHMGHLELNGLTKGNKHEKPPCKIVPYKSFLIDIYGPFHIAEYDVIVLNNGICVETLSFALIKIINDFRGFKGKCYACDVTLNLDEWDKHTTEKKHKNIIMQCKVLPMKIEGDEELIRQIYPGLYHCGFCNKVFPFWENMAKHLKSYGHKVEKGKKKLLSKICAKLLLNPLECIEDLGEYNTLKTLEITNYVE